MLWQLPLQHKISGSFATLAGNSIAANTGKRAVTEYVKEQIHGIPTTPLPTPKAVFLPAADILFCALQLVWLLTPALINTSDVSKPLTRTFVRLECTWEIHILQPSMLPKQHMQPTT
jgi:hypothetical protein